MNMGRRSTLGLAAVLIIASSIVSAPSDARAADQVSGRIVYQTVDGIHSINADGTDDRTLAQGGANHGASWSPDGKQILFLTYGGELYVMNRDGSNAHRLRQLGGSVESASWSPDGKTLALSYLPPRTTADRTRRSPGLFLLSADGQDEPRLVRENSSGVRWSPDGKKVVFDDPGLFTLLIANADGSNDVPLIASGIFQDASGPAWSPDGKQIALVGRTTSQAGIFIVNSDGSGVRLLVANSGEWNCNHPSWSPDGSQLAFSCAATPNCYGVGVAPGNILQKRGPCVRPLFVLSVNDPRAKPIRITDHDALFPEFAPR